MGCQHIFAFHMGDELSQDNITNYSHYDFIFRNYYDESRLINNRILYIPLGMKSGIQTSPVNTLIRASERQYVCNFIGSVRNDRREMLNKLKESDLSCYFDADRKWADKNSLKSMQFRLILRSSTFTLSPYGNNYESMRFYEALEAGSIPVIRQILDVKKSFLTPMAEYWGSRDLPFLIVPTWNLAGPMMKTLMNNPDRLNKLQAAMVTFWNGYKQSVQIKMKDKIDQILGS